MAITDIEDNDLAAPGDARQRGFKNDVFIVNASKAKAFAQTDSHYSNFLGIDLRGKAYHSEEDEVAAYEKDVKNNKFEKAFPTIKKQNSCNDVDAMLDQIDIEVTNLNRKAQSAKPAFRARWESLTDQLRQHRNKFEQANASLNCSDVRKAAQDAENQKYVEQLKGVLQTAVQSSSSKTSLTPYIVIGTIGILGVGAIIYFVIRRKKQQV